MTSEALLLAVHPVLMSADVPRACAFFARLGFATLFVDDDSQQRYAVLRRDGVTLHVQWNEPPPVAVERPSYRLLVRDVDALYAELAAVQPPVLATAGSSPWASPGDTPWGTREFHLRDPDGNGLHFYQPASH